ncbi:universal stress protein [Vreelandella neptunia]|uniref:Universal stress protein n=1 Tax=Vreelandella neptunia TaxID=115551 RepID=A0ABZ0YUX0_9GAMM|nr:universal stress protein [Halomonas neptunia]MDN3559899.1 universal stress protein [Halomonas neptunia]TDV95831.1 nucleotide-binding universal stress UspA family protein [Halomonas alkaliantarctica]WQH15020.1 universal stress protein [Halomonas neptunia]
MKIMIAYDGSRNAKLALAQVVNMFRCNQPLLVLVGVVENPLDATDNNEVLFQQEHDEVKQHLQEGVAFALGEGFQAEQLLAEGDARKMLLQATRKLSPDLLVIARHSHQPDGGIIAKSLTYFVDELDYMTFGSVSSFLARRAECPLLILPSP